MAVGVLFPVASVASVSSGRSLTKTELENSLKEIENEISELTEDGSPYWNKTHPNHKKTVDQVFKLREQLNG